LKICTKQVISYLAGYLSGYVRGNSYTCIARSLQTPI